MQDVEKNGSQKDPDTYEPWMKALMSADGKQCDWTDRSYLEPILKDFKKFEKMNGNTPLNRIRDERQRRD